MEIQLDLINQFCIYDNKESLLEINIVYQNVLIQYAIQSLKKYGHLYNMYTNKSLHILNTLRHPPIYMKSEFNILAPVPNSCYMDSLLMSLFSQSNKYLYYKLFIDQNITECAKLIRKELYNIYLYITKNENYNKYDKKYTCMNLKKELNKCKSTTEFSDYTMNDPIALLIGLFQIFNMSNMQMKNTIHVKENNKWIQISTTIDSNVSIIKPINILSSNNLLFIEDFIYEKDILNFDISNLYINNKTGKKYKRIIKYSEILNTDFLIFAMYRFNKGNQLGDFNKFRIYPNETIELINGKKFYLYSCVIYTGNKHYVSYFLNNNKWYIYNDLSSEFKIIGSFIDMMKLDKSPITHGVLFFYNLY